MVRSQKRQLYKAQKRENAPTEQSTSRINDPRRRGTVGQRGQRAITADCDNGKAKARESLSASIHGRTVDVETNIVGDIFRHRQVPLQVSILRCWRNARFDEVHASSDKDAFPVGRQLSDQLIAVRIRLYPSVVRARSLAVVPMFKRTVML